MRETVGEFAAKVAAKGPDTVALVFYAGHGLQIDGENFLVRSTSTRRGKRYSAAGGTCSTTSDTLTSVAEQDAHLLLDACRNNPFPAINKSTGHGLRSLTPRPARPARSCLFRPHRVAGSRDGSGADSPYTVALLSAAKEPGFRSRDTFSACVFRSTRRPRATDPVG